MSSHDQQTKIDYSPLEKEYSLLSSLQLYIENKSSRLMLMFYAGLGTVILVYAIWLMVNGHSAAPFVLALLTMAIVGFFVVRAWQDLHKMKVFAAKNDWHLLHNETSQAFEGMIFDVGHSRRTTGYAMSQSSIIGAIANHMYVTGHGKHQRSHSYGFVHIRLPRNLPHMVLDARKNNFLGISNLSTNFKSGQRLQLEGDFNKHFTLYAPQKYERDALYIFTPDIMQLLVDTVADYDVEIVGNSLFVYSSKAIKLTRRADIERLMQIADKLAAKFDRRVDYYADEKVDDRDLDLVAPQGARLKTGISIITVIILVIFGLVYFLPMIVDLISLTQVER